MSLTPAFLDELRARTTLSALIGKSVKLTKAGREFRGCCPFHNEKTPSFYVNDDKSFYHCFGCSAHGDAIRWLTDQQGLPFIDAVKELAAAAGMELPAPDPRTAERAVRDNSLYDVMAAAAEWFAAQLSAEGGAAARAYLLQREIAPPLWRDFGLGLAPDSRGGLKAALARFSESKLIEAGLLILVEGKESYDRFRGRLMIPIKDARGRVIAFGGRILGAGEPKYLNSPDTPLFDKGRTLYNLDRAAPASRKTGRVIIVEGYLDVIALAKAGIHETVAPLGTALTEPQLERLWRLAAAPILCFDGDNAGQKAALRAAHRALPMVAPAQTLQFVTLPTGKDPDDLVRSGGRDAFDTLLAQPLPLVDQLWLFEQAAAPLATPEARAGLKQRLSVLAQQIADIETRSQYAREFRNRCDRLFTPERTPFQPQYGKGRKASERRFTIEPQPSADAHSISENGFGVPMARAILNGLLRHPSVLYSHAEILSGLNLPDQQQQQLCATMLDAAYHHSGLDSPTLIAICEERGFTNLRAEMRLPKGLKFSFVCETGNQDTARQDLALVIETIVARPELHAALSNATRECVTNSGELALAAQQRWRTALNDDDERLIAYAQSDVEI